MSERRSRRTRASVSTNEPMPHSSTTFSPDTARMCSRPLRRMSSTAAGGHGLLVAQHHGLEDLAHRRAQAAADVAAGREAQPVDETAEPAAAPVEAQRGERRGEHDVLAAPLEVAPVVEGARLGHRQRLDLGRGSASRVPSTSGPSEVKRRRGRSAEVERERGAFGHRARRRPTVTLTSSADPVAADLGQGQRGRPQGDRCARRSASGGSAPARRAAPRRHRARRPRRAAPGP